MDIGCLRIKQFLFASFNRIGYRLIKGQELDKIISEGSIIHLCRQGGRREQQTFVHAFLPEEKLFTISCITPGVDSSGRTNSHNRTLVINTRELEEIFKQQLTERIPFTPPKELPDLVVRLEIQNG